MKILRLALATFPALAALALTTHAQHDDPPPQGAAEYDKDAKPELAVVRAKTGHLLVRPTINGVDAGWFIFDSGAGICVLSTPVADQFELESGEDMPAHGVGGDSTMPSLVAPTLALGPITLHDVPLMKTDLSFVNEHLGYDVAGVIGYGLFSKCIVELDLKAPRIALYDPKGYTLPAGEWAPLAFDHLIPTVKATYEGHEGLFQLDLGSNSAVSFQEATVRRLALLEGRAVRDAKQGGVGGFLATKSGRIAWLEIAGVRLTDVEAVFPLEAKGVAADLSYDGSFGVGVLESFLMTFDYAGKRISLRKHDAAPAGG